MESINGFELKIAYYVTTIGTKKYFGRVKVYESGEYQYSHGTGISRLNQWDALNDAEELRNSLWADGLIEREQ